MADNTHLDQSSEDLASDDATGRPPVRPPRSRGGLTAALVAPAEATEDGRQAWGQSARPAARVTRVDGAEGAPFRIQIDAAEQVMYAMAHNRVPIVRSFAVEANTARDTRHIQVEVSLTWSREQRPPAHPVSFTIELPEGASGPVEIDQVGLKLDDTVVVDLEEAVPATLSVRVQSEEGHDQVESREIRILARNQWAFDPAAAAINTAFGTLLAAFVQPNHPTVNEILASAGKILKSRTGSSSLEGYQSGAERATEIGQAIFEALQAEGIRYIDPPASFESSQKIRPIDQVLSEKQGTCIDLACAYASCLEQAGLYPLIWIVPHHAFAGFLTEEGALPVSFMVDETVNLNLVSSGLAVSAETVGLTDGMSFGEARSKTSNRHKAEKGKLWGLIDVVAAHRSGMLPIPARVQRGDVIEIVIDRGPGRGAVVDKRDTKTGKRVREVRPPRIQSWESSLLDLSLRNSLIKFTTGRSGLDFLTTDQMLEQIEDDLNAGRSINILPGNRLEGAEAAAGLRDISQVQESTLVEMYANQSILYSPMGGEAAAKRIRTLVSKSRLVESETGSNNLYLVLGTMVWTSEDGKEIRSPLFLVPVRLRRPRGKQVGVIEIDDTFVTTPNYCLVEKLRAEFALDIPEFENPPEDSSGIDLGEALRKIRRAVIKRDLKVRIDGSAHLAVLDYSKFRLWKDLRDHWSTFMGNGLVRHLVENPGGLFQDPNRSTDGAATTSSVGEHGSELETWCPIPADGTQLRAIERAAAGDSFVIEGPPGTGKSQTITNLLANALARGKTVLFVAEKQAALSVVKERLHSIGLDPYCLDLHDKGSKPAEIRAQIGHALDHRPEADVAAFEKLTRDLKIAHGRLADYRDVLYEANPLGMTYRWAHDELLRIGDGPTAAVPVSLSSLSVEEAGRLDEEVQELEAKAQAAQPSADHPWRFSRLTDLASVDRSALSSKLRAVTAALGRLPESLPPVLEALLAQIATLKDLETVVVLMEELRRPDRPDATVLDEAASGDWLERITRACEEVRATASKAELLIQKRGDRPLRLPAAALEQHVQTVSEAASSFFIGRRKRIDRSVVALLGRPAPERWSRASAEAFVRHLRSVRAEYDEAYRSFSEVAGHMVVSREQFETPAKVDQLLTSARRLSAIATLLARGDEAGEKARGLGHDDAATWQPGLAAGLRLVAEALGPFLNAASAQPDETLAWVRGRGVVRAVREAHGAWLDDAREDRFLSLQRWATLMSASEGLRTHGLTEFRGQMLDGVLPSEVLGNAYHRGVVRMSLRERAEQMQLDSFDRLQHDRVINRFVEGTSARRTVLERVIPFQLDEGRAFDTRVPFGEVAELRAELRRKRGAKSIRKLVSEYGPLIQGLVPCFLMSPDSVAKFLPAGGLTFDIAVFDEASQIVVAEAVGAMGRARAVIIVGDSKQMPPTRFGGGGGDEDLYVEDDEVASVEDAESLLLEAVDSGMDRVWLSWHYRSQDESLIAFSNRHYYEGRLSSFPSPRSLSGSALTWHNVGGQFEHGKRRVNEAEADAVVREVLARLNDPDRIEQSIGVVTLNSQQQAEVVNRLEASGDDVVLEQLERDGSDDLFVRNLENVQGHERDVIIFSTGFSRTKDGKPMPLNFGPLNRAGGERRLNVAVTRAKKEMVIFSSFEPEEIDLNRAKAVGLLHLREFLMGAKRGMRAVTDEHVVSMVKDLHRENVRAALEARGLKVGEDIGLSPFRIDLAVTTLDDPHWRVAVLLDGSRWRDRTTVGDRDGLPLEVLQGLMGWPHVVRVWLPAWRAEQSAILDEIEDLVRTTTRPERASPSGSGRRSRGGLAGAPTATGTPIVRTSARNASAVKSEPAPRGAVPSSSERGSEGSAASESPAEQSAADTLIRAGAKQFEPYAPSRPAGTAEHCAPGAEPGRVSRVIEEIVEQEGPVELGRLGSLVASAFGVGRLYENRRKFIESCIEASWRHADQRGEFVWGTTAADRRSETAVRLSRADEAERTIDQIATEEVVNAMQMIARMAQSIPTDQLMQVTANAFGVRRVTQGIQESLRIALGEGLRSGILRELTDGRIAG